MPIRIGQSRDRGFDEPLGLLSDCHRRIEHFLLVLATVTREAAGGSLVPAHRTAFEGALKYFAEAAPRHTEDEELSLFPRLRTSANPSAVAALATLDLLERDHDVAEAEHAAVDALVRRWLAADRLPPVETAALSEHLTRLQALYSQHIAVEDGELFPAAAQALGPGELEQIGREMAERRGIRGVRGPAPPAPRPWES